ncbi:hypothetical protein [uncultured Robinsoniella sp.]|uniref:hypothetical protein n=1 Tax=uncultured Robinsoniella sp. TaxID=904190 RepID=UPI00374F8585
MDFINKLERKFGRYGIRNLSLYLIICYILGYTFNVFQPNIMDFLTLEPYYILRGQIWRIVTWILVPPESLSIFTVIMLFFYYSLGTSLENTWGAFRYTLYILAGILFTDIGAFILYFILGGGKLFGPIFSTYYINMSIFLAFALCYPNMQVLLYFVIPIKIKWMGILYGVFILFSFFKSSWPIKVAIIASLMNFIIFFLGTRDFRRVSPGEIKRKKKFKQETRQSTGGLTKHKCAICGRTELDGEDLEFRFCSKCDGNYEYCQDHLFTHEHVKKHHR